MIVRSLLAGLLLIVAMPRQAQADYYVGGGGGLQWTTQTGFGLRVGLGADFDVNDRVAVGLNLSVRYQHNVFYGMPGQDWASRLISTNAATLSLDISSKYVGFSIGGAYDWTAPSFPVSGYASLTIHFWRLHVGIHGQVGVDGYNETIFAGILGYTMSWGVLSPICSYDRFLGGGCGIAWGIVPGTRHVTIQGSAQWLAWQPERREQFDPKSVMLALNFSIHTTEKQ